MKLKVLAVIALIASAVMVSCDDTTDTIGTSLTDNKDLLDVTADTFGVKSYSIVAGNVLSRNTTGYLGKVRDPETGSIITGNFMAQFSTLENYEFPETDSIVSVENGEIIADSCNIRLFFTEFYGDSLATMNLTAYEMDTPVEENEKLYSDLDPINEGYVKPNECMKVNKAYTLADLTLSLSDRSSTSYTPNIKIGLNKPYNKGGKTYKNYGTYIMQTYYEHPDYFKNPYNFIHNVCPGFYFKINDGLGSMAYVTVSQLNVYFRYKSDSTYVGMSSFSATEEVLQTTNITNDDDVIKQLADDSNPYSMLKTPAGIFTVLELPVDSIAKEHKKFNSLTGNYENVTVNHERDTINTAKLTLTRINNSTHTDYNLDVPSTLLMIPLDSINTFFEKEKVADYKQSFLAVYSSSTNSYTFSNISGMINFMSAKKASGLDKTDENWNKVVIIPVNTTVNSSSEVTKVVHDMSLASTKLVKGTSFMPNCAVKLTAIYSKFNQ